MGTKVRIFFQIPPRLERKSSAWGHIWKTSTWEAALWHSWEAIELHLFLDGLLNAGLPVFVKAVDVLVEEGKTVCQPFLHDLNFLVVRTDAIVGKHADRVELGTALAAHQQLWILFEVTVRSL